MAGAGFKQNRSVPLPRIMLRSDVQFILAVSGQRWLARFALLAVVSGLCAGCRRGAETNVARGNRERVLHIGCGSEPHDLDPQTATGVPEADILAALEEGLVTLDPVTLRPKGGVAASWEISGDGLTYTFHLRPNARWSNGEPLSARDFVDSYRRILSPVLGAQFSYFLWALRNAREYNKGTLKDFTQVGVHALDAQTLQFQLHDPAPYLLAQLYARFWAPVQLSTVAKHGSVDAPGNTWTLAGNFVGNGPFQLVEWQPNQRIVVRRNPYYWDAANVWLKEIRFYPIEDIQAEENAFRAGQIHATYQVPQTKVDTYRHNHPELLRLDPYELHLLLSP